MIFCSGEMIPFFRKITIIIRNKTYKSNQRAPYKGTSKG